MLKVNINSISSLNNAKEAIARGIESGVFKAGEMVKDGAKELCPVRTGALKNSIAAKHSENTSKISAGKDYGVFVEFGTSKMCPQPFMVPALLNNADAAVKIIADEITNNL